MAQNPYQMGYGAVNAAYKAAIGEELAETKVDTGADVVTPENSDDFRA
jgi:ribose transport system substrate-binding protein